MRRKGIALLLSTLMITTLFSGFGSTSNETTEDTAKVEEKEEVSFPYDEFTVNFDANTTPDDLTDDESFTYWTTGWASEKKTSTVTYPATADAYILSGDVPVPKREGYYFAGWQTKPVVTDEDIVDGVSKYQVFFDEKISALGQGAIKTKSDEEIKARGIEQDVNYIKDMENLTEDGTVTFYARWVEAKEISTVEDLKNIKNDLYGAYVLANDITLDEKWEPIGKYYTNYEYFNVDWWTYAFRGTFDGQGHTISGLTLKGGEVEDPGYSEMEDARWYNDGPDCGGASGLFGAACNATFKNVVLDNVTIDIAGENAYSGDHLYAAALCCFDMGSAITDVKVSNLKVDVEYGDKDLKYAESMFTSVAGLEAGSWSTNISNCAVENAQINMNVTSEKSHGGEVYVGGMLGECYSGIKTSTCDAKITVNGKDASEAKEDLPFILNVGGFGAANASAQEAVAKNTIDVNFEKAKGSSSVNIGGFTGAQRYQQILKSDVTSDITANCNVEKDSLNVGALIGRMDVFYASLILKYADGVKCGCADNNVAVTYNGDAYDVLLPDSGYPQIDGEKVEYIATKDFTDEKTGTSYKKNIDEIVDAYGSYLPKEELENPILYIEVK